MIKILFNRSPQHPIRDISLVSIAAGITFGIIFDQFAICMQVASAVFAVLLVTHLILRQRMGWKSIKVDLTEILNIFL